MQDLLYSVRFSGGAGSTVPHASIIKMFKIHTAQITLPYIQGGE